MIRIDVELQAHGDQAYSRDIARLLIVNDDTGDHEHGNYDVYLTSFDNGATRAYAHIKNFPREEGWGRLVSEALEEFGYGTL